MQNDTYSLNLGEIKSFNLIYIFNSDFVWRMQLMIIKGKIRVLFVGNFEPLLLIN